MTEPTSPTQRPEDDPPGSGTAPATEPPAVPAGADPLDDYIRANYRKYSEGALRQSALAAGNSPEAVETALGRYRQLPATKGSEARVARVTRLAYLGVFAVLTVGMLINDVIGINRGVGILGIVVLGVTLAIGYALAHLWIRSRRAGLVIVGAILALIGLANLTFGGIVAVVLLLAGVGMLVGARFVGGPRGARFAESAAVLFSIPLLILLAIGGACVATGLPIPNA